MNKTYLSTTLRLKKYSYKAICDLLDFLRQEWRSRKFKWNKSKNSNHLNPRLSGIICSYYRSEEEILKTYGLNILQKNWNNIQNRIFIKFSKTLMNLLRFYSIKPSLWVFGASDSFLSTLIYVCVFSKTCICLCW